MAQPTLKTAFDLGPTEKRDRKETEKKQEMNHCLPYCYTCQWFLRNYQLKEKESHSQSIKRKKCKRTEYVLKDLLGQHHVLIKENKRDHSNIQHSIATMHLRGITPCSNQYLSALTEQCRWFDRELNAFCNELSRATDILIWVKAISGLRIRNFSVLKKYKKYFSSLLSMRVRCKIFFSSFINSQILQQNLGAELTPSWIQL